VRKLPNTHNFSCGFFSFNLRGPVRILFPPRGAPVRAANRGAIGSAEPELKRRAASAPRRVKLNDPQLKLGAL